MEPKDQKERPLPLEACLLIYDEELVKQERVSDSSPIRAKRPEL